MLYGDRELSVLCAREKNLARINELIARSKSHWDWPADYLERALRLLRVLPGHLERTHSFEVWAAQTSTLVAFFSLDASGSQPLLENLWVEPRYLGRGIGTFACKHIFRFASQKGWTEISVMPDPPSEGFYAELGFVDTGERMPSRVPGGPVFAVYRIRIPRPGK